MKKEKKADVTGIGPLSSIGIGKDILWDSILNEKTGLILEDYKIDNEKLESYYVHRLKGFNIESFGIDKSVIQDIRTWKGQEVATDLFYLLAVVKLALDDSKINYRDVNESKKIGLVLTHENPGLEQFYEEVINETYDLLSTNGKKPISKKKYSRHVG